MRRITWGSFADAAIRNSVARIRIAIRANEHKWRPIGSNENTPWVAVTIPAEREKNGQQQNEKMKFESSKHEMKLSMKLTAQAQARILSKKHREPANKPETTNKLKKKTTNGTRRRKSKQMVKKR